jgi:molybdate transport system substrate-binding protein
MPKRRPLAVVMRIVLLVLCAGCTHSPPTGGSEQASNPVVVFAAASMSSAMEDLRRQFTRETGIDVQTNYASSAVLAQQIVHGADADLFVSADIPWADYVDQDGRVAERRNLFGNRLVVIVPGDSKLAVSRLTDLTAPEVERLAMADPKAAPAGRYARRALEKTRLWDALKSKVAAAEDVRTALTYVETGAADAGIVYATDAAISRKVRVAFAVPADPDDPIVYPVVLLAQAREKPAARRFWEYVQSLPATGLFERYGFVVSAHDAASRD